MDIRLLLNTASSIPPANPVHVDCTVDNKLNEVIESYNGPSLPEKGIEPFSNNRPLDLLLRGIEETNINNKTANKANDTPHGDQNRSDTKQQHASEDHGPLKRNDSAHYLAPCDMVPPSTEVKEGSFATSSLSEGTSITNTTAVPNKNKKHQIKAGRPAQPRPPEPRVRRRVRRKKIKIGTKENPDPCEVRMVNGWTCYVRCRNDDEAGDQKRCADEEASTAAPR